ncbi:hypothetical protein Pst134EA_007667 [Puccinia striiformis f. sp. tritici]|uniref:hypothetical protein n=1 Tax=Puccinia striiformis f. sp. tritici TaxID=168172 RepID=UPI0020088B6E|nr:hypothetical protein Pst134EA_007667 [Puccinia striiformis f. sp. tritici]KAH9470409.1 hypothetical protein Pst134EA_007667 [Puccinia striiformis f. sp. tritici]KAI9610993.1 hypothetical protein H4Q26_008840 [Puccinia striiformis f. sp. tritici PST-130]
MVQSRKDNQGTIQHETPVEQPTENQSQHHGHEEPQSPVLSQYSSLTPLNDNPTEIGQPSHHWFKSWSKALSPVAWLENKSSVARDHLANERTFLAWFRTSLSLTSIGIALVQLSRVSKQIKVARIQKFMTISVQPIVEPLTNPSSSLLSSNGLLFQNLVDFSEQDNDSIQFALNQINQNLINLQSSIDGLNLNVESIRTTRNLASLIGNCYVCIGLLFLFIGTHRYFRVQQVLQLGQFPHSKWSIGIITLLVSILLIFTAIGLLRTSF